MIYELDMSRGVRVCLYQFLLTRKVFNVCVCGGGGGGGGGTGGWGGVVKTNINYYQNTKVFWLSILMYDFITCGGFVMGFF